MVVAADMSWPHGAIRLRRHHLFFHDKHPPATLGILAFDAAKTMRSLASLYKSLTDEELTKLCRETIKSKGVVYLNSDDHVFLLNLACAERLEQLDLAAAMVSHLGRKCSDFSLNHFDLVYADLKQGIIDIRKLEFRTRRIQKIIERMERWVSSTSNLHTAMEALDQTEASLKKVQRWKTTGQHGHNNGGAANIDYLNERHAFIKKQVQHCKEASLWNRTFDKSVGYMARIVCVIYARICSVFGPFVTGVTSLRKNKKNDKIRSGSNRPDFEATCFPYRTNLLSIEEKSQNLNRVSKSGPIPKTSKSGVIRFSDNLLSISEGGSVGSGSPEPLGFHADGEEITSNNNRVFRMAPPSTVGGSGLSLRYANVVISAERCLHTPATVGEEARDSLYEMLPMRLRGKVRAKLRRHWLSGKKEMEEEEDGYSLAEGWRAAVEELMEWLSPVAHDTVRWQQERNLEKLKFDTNPTVLLLETFHYSDLEKAETAIVEVLVGLSCIYRYEKRRTYIGGERESACR
ncbi:hypothetical protein L6164_000524 [Bauhinia variegata]|uniref:Uncharacterized protein n=1 Tax=Bauhinia variegata TaxID=167791 RepID=A0ACB9Q672_BAUVA|nr:hypothetical protein L6164_000524 [Bauhinia variegata]